MPRHVRCIAAIALVKEFTFLLLVTSNFRCCVHKAIRWTLSQMNSTLSSQSISEDCFIIILHLIRDLSSVTTLQSHKSVSTSLLVDGRNCGIDLKIPHRFKQFKFPVLNVCRPPGSPNINMSCCQSRYP